MNATDISNFNGHQLRHAMIDGEPWFVAGDACRILYASYDSNKGTHAYLYPVDKAYRRRVTRETSPELFTGKRGAPTMSVISEPGLYALITRAHTSNPEAKEFQRWVFEVVLPSIRKTGGYLLNESKREKAFADVREEMPLPAEFMAAFKQMAEDNAMMRSQLVDLHLEVDDFRRTVVQLLSGPKDHETWTDSSGKASLIVDLDTKHLRNILKGTFGATTAQLDHIKAVLQQRRAADAAARKEKKEKARLEELAKAQEQKSKAEALIAKLTA